MSLSPGTRLGPYEIVAQIGAGGMGEVYRASDTRLARHVALKVIAPQWAKDRQVRLRFEREARAISALSHPHVCTLHDIGTQGDLEYLVMEFVEGETLADRLIRGPLSVEEFVHFGSEIADALEIAHASGITHRDLKPANIMITARGSVKILDFGLAKLSEVLEADNDHATDVRTAAGVVVGTFRYMSPEQAGGESAAASSDIFSFGVILYEAITGRHPFEAGTRSELIRSIVSVDPVRPSTLRAGLPPGIDDLLGKMLAKAPSERLTAAAVRQELNSGALVSAPMSRRARPARHIVGRERERDEILARLAQDHGLVISVVGEAGLGKTTLVDECLAAFQERSSARIGMGRCSERLAGSEAYLPILEGLADFVKKDPALGHTLKVVAPAWFRNIATAPDSSPDAAASVGVAGQERLKRELSAFFEEAAKRRPIVLCLDDVHWADTSTVDLIGYLAMHLGMLPLFIVTTARQSELLLRKHPFLQLARELQPRGSLHQVQVQFLTGDDVLNYVKLEFPENRFGGEFHRLIYEKTEGSPLFMVDLLRYLRDQEVIALRDGVWMLTREVGEIEQEIPASVRSMIARKIDQLSDDERRLLVAASVQGAEFDSAVVARALGADQADAEEILARLDQLHELVAAIDEQEHSDGTPTLRYRFVHVLYQNSLYGSLGPARKAALSAKVAASLLNVSGENTAPVASQLALLFESARDFGQATEFFFTAAQHARRLFANRESTLLARHGLDVAKRIGDEAERQRKSSRLHELLGDVYALIGQHGDAQSEYDETLRTSAPDDALSRARVHRKSANVFVTQRSYPEAAAAFDAAETAIDRMRDDSSERSYEWMEIQLDRGWMLYWKNDLAAMDRLVDSVEPSLERAKAQQRARYFQTRTLAGFRRERYAVSEDTLALARAALSASIESGDAQSIRTSKFLLGFSHMWRNELDDSQTLLQESLQESERAGDIVLQTRCVTYLTVLARKRRDQDAVRTLAARSIEIAAASDMREYIALGKGNLAWLAWRQQNPDEALRQGFEALEIWRGLPVAHVPLWWTAGFPLLAVLVELGRSSEAIDVARVVNGPDQHRLNQELQDALGHAINLWDAQRPQEAGEELRRSCELAKENLLL